MKRRSSTIKRTTMTPKKSSHSVGTGIGTKPRKSLPGSGAMSATKGMSRGNMRGV